MKIGTLFEIMSKHALDSKVQNFYFLENIQTNMPRMTIDLVLFNARVFVKFFISFFSQLWENKSFYKVQVKNSRFWGQGSFKIQGSVLRCKKWPFLRYKKLSSTRYDGVVIRYRVEVSLRYRERAL